MSLNQYHSLRTDIGEFPVLKYQEIMLRAECLELLYKRCLEVFNDIHMGLQGSHVNVGCVSESMFDVP